MVIVDEDGGGQIEYLQPTPSGPLKNEIFLLGQATQNWLVRVGTSRAYMVPLKPLALPLLLGSLAADCTDSLVKLDDFIPGCRLLVDQLLAQKSQLGQLVVLDASLKRLFRNVPINPSGIDGAVQRILRTQGQVKVEELSRQERISLRTLTRRFTEQVGLSPKQYAQVIRFRAIMHHVFMAHKALWVDVVHRFGYYDQSHFIKDFHHFTGHAPTEYLAFKQQFDAQLIKTIATF